MKTRNIRNSAIEPLEARIAPATVGVYPKPSDPETEWIPLPLGTPVKLSAGQGLSTLGDKKGSYLLFIEQGSAIIFTQDYDGDDTFDSNEITGIAAGDGLRLISFVDIHGDIVTNLKETTFTEDRGGTIVTNRILTLSDSDNNPSNDSQGLKGDGRVLLNNRIEKVELRPLTIADLVDQNGNNNVDVFDLDLRQPPKSTFSIYGSIFAGAGFGAEDGGLLFNPTADGRGVATDFVPMVDAIRIGTAVSGKFYSFGVSGEYKLGALTLGDNLNGIMSPFVPAVGASGGGINTVKNLDQASPFNIGFLVAGNGGAGGDGGSVSNVTMFSDDTGGYQLIAGNGGTGRSGGNGGSILNFSDVGSFTGLVVLSGGDGGIGTIGSGGNAGNSEFTTLNLKGNIHIDMGDGGNGFTNGGNGASLASGVFTEPQTLNTKILNGWGTTHLPDGSARTYTSRLGVTAGIDFNNDGEGDLVYATSDASQLMVLISDPTDDASVDPVDTGWKTFKTPDGLENQGIYLSGPRNAKALSVGDVNADGHPDIVAASRDFGGTGDLVVFLARFEDANNDRIISSDEDLDGSGAGSVNPLDPLNEARDPRYVSDDFVGFYEGRHSTIPILNRNSFGVNDLAIGDFDGDGFAEIIVGAGTNAVFMMPDFEFNPVTGEKELTGQFYYDYGHKTERVDGVTYQATLKFPFVPVTPGNGFRNPGMSTPYRPVVVEATTLTTNGDTFDVAMISGWGTNVVGTIDWSAPARVGADAEPVIIDFISLGVVDLDRGNEVNLDAFRLYDFTTVDLNNDGNTDVAAISLDQGDHSGFLNGSYGDGQGFGVSFSGGGNQAGNYFKILNETSLYTIRAADAGGGLNDLLITHEVGALYVLWAPGPDAAGTLASITYAPPVIPGDQGENETNHTFADTVFDDVTDASSLFHALGSIDVRRLEFNDGPPGPDIFPDLPILEYSLAIAAGDGGSGLVGKGGVGGFLGGKSTLEAAVDPATGGPLLDFFTGIPITNLVGAIRITPSVTVQLQAGTGGNGFSDGGNGGTISGVAIYEGNALVLNHRLGAGDGGRGVFGKGGNGGNLISNSLFAGVEFIAGDGGVGKFGGTGGSIIGSSASYDVYNSSVAAIAGDGGIGTVTGGAGGSISNFRARIPDPRNAGEPAASTPPIGLPLRHFLYYQAGDGGSAVTGRGGDGGSVVGSSPLVGVQLMGELIVYAGDGGIGNSGGNGGSIDKFSVFPDGESNDYLPKFVTLLGGKGGNSFTGKAGNGGNLTNLNVVGLSSETFTTTDIQSVYGVYQVASRFHFNRLIAGAGGLSAGNDGGQGGSVSNVIAFTPLGSFGIVSGAGGDGFRKGGAGGAISNVRIDFGASSISKALIAAGAGGDATSFIFNPIDGTPNQALDAFGGKVGKGGNGGSINGVVQKGGLDSHLDIVAGDGGSTINYGTVRDKKGFVGVGGSVRNINIASSLGNASQTVALKSYNDVLNGQSFANFVQTSLIDELPAPFDAARLDDALGNVGIIVGAAGRNKAYVLDPFNDPTIYRTIPSRFGINGSLEFVFAKNLVAAVAGSVDRIASIQSYKAVTISNATGGDKTARLVTVPGGVPTLVEDFADVFGIPTTSHEPVLEGIMVDGAIVAKKFLNAKGQKVPPPINGYIR